MEAKHPRPNPPGLVSQDEGGLWVKMDPDHVKDHIKSPGVTCVERPRDETHVTPTATAAPTSYDSEMADEATIGVFMPPPTPPDTAPLLPAEGSAATVNNCSVTLANGPADATEAKANPSGLERHHGERQVVATHNEGDEVITITEHTSRDNVSLPKHEDCTPPEDQDRTSMEDIGSLVETCHDPSRGHHRNNINGEGEPNVEYEDVGILSEGRDNWRKTEVETDKYAKQVTSNTEESLENETCFDNEGDKTISEDICGLAETDSKLLTENVGCNSVETRAASLSLLTANNDDFDSCGSPELHKCDQNKMDGATSQPHIPDIPAEGTSDDEEHVDTRPLNYSHTKDGWVRRESGSSDTQRLSMSEGSEEMPSRAKEDGSGRLSLDIQQGEQLLQRLQEVQLRQDADVSESPCTSQQVVQETGREVDDLKGKEGDLTDGQERGESRYHVVEDEGAKRNLLEREKKENKDVEENARPSPTMPVEEQHHMIARTEAGGSANDQHDRWVPVNLPLINSHGTCSSQVPLLSTRNRFSSTDLESQMHEADKGKQNLQRADGVFNLAENPDVLEIPFKTNVSFEPLPTETSPGQRSDWQFSAQKMKKEISQEIQRELVLVNQGKIPGGYNKEEIRQLKETKLLFEAFQQDNTEGPTRYRKPHSSLMKGHVYPSVLERTHSLEMFSLKSCSISRTHSLRLYKSTMTETEGSPEDIRAKSPTGGSREKARLSPYPKQEKHVRQCKSMDSITADASMSDVGARNKSGQGSQGSPILKQNPFFKLRPALALKPEVEKDIREAKQREEELRRQRCTLYGENRQNSEDGENSRLTQALAPDARKQSRGKLERVWPPPSKTDQMKSEQAQQGPKMQRSGGQKAPLWQRWESGLINGQPSKEEN